MKIFFLFLIGAVAGTILDGLQTWGGVAVYADPWILKTAWWVPFLFGGATVLVALSHAKIHPMSAATRTPTSFQKSFVGSLVFLIGVSFLAPFSPFSSLQKGALIFLLYFISWGIFDRTLLSLVLALATGVLGPLVESSLGIFGLYKYTAPDWLGVPYWLPFLYLHISATAGFLGRLPRKTTIVCFQKFC